jgi:hypothetical protein
MIETLEAIRASVNGRISILQELEVHFAVGGLAVHITEAPDAKDAESGRMQVVEREVNIRIVGQVTNPVAICAGEVVCLTVDREI